MPRIGRSLTYKLIFTIRDHKPDLDSASGFLAELTTTGRSTRRRQFTAACGSRWLL